MPLSSSSANRRILEALSTDGLDCARGVRAEQVATLAAEIAKAKSKLDYRRQERIPHWRATVDEEGQYSFAMAL
jgi:hypothetical protein